MRRGRSLHHPDPHIVGPGSRDPAEPTPLHDDGHPVRERGRRRRRHQVAVPNEDPLSVEELPDARAHRSNGLGPSLVHHERHGLLDRDVREPSHEHHAREQRVPHRLAGPQTADPRRTNRHPSSSRKKAPGGKRPRPDRSLSTSYGGTVSNPQLLLQTSFPGFFGGLRSLGKAILAFSAVVSLTISTDSSRASA